MRLTTIKTGSTTRAARVEGDQLIPLRAPDVGALLASGLQSAAAEVDGNPIALTDASFALLIPNPAKAFCVGLNYALHIKETGAETPQYPTIFNKYADSFIGPNEDLVLPSSSEKVDWEVELGVVMGSRLHKGSESDAQAAIAGYVVFNDISIRDWQSRTTQWLQGKVFPASTPIGPFLVTPDEVGNAEDLALRTEINGEVMQDGRTSDLVFGPAAIVSYVSQFTPLSPGDMFLTGTPSGVGVARKPQIFLKPGDLCKVSIEGLGECVNRCVAEG